MTHPTTDPLPHQPADPDPDGIDRHPFTDATHTAADLLPQQAADLDPDVRAQSWDAASELGDIFRAAGLRLYFVKVNDAEEGAPSISLGNVDAATALDLARRVRESMKPLFRAGDALHRAFLACDLETSGPHVESGRLQLGKVSVPTADRLACLLGAAPQDEGRDITEWPEAQKVVERLGKAFKTATRGGFLDPTFEPECFKCHCDAEIDLGSLGLRTGRRLAGALQATARR
ncbi:hypothetical protein G3I60_42765 [Streptomyces sp. SID13666]|uniref:hypothetical protein n=1 Tax=unclassified Streptomyces TaxID=2593676 RepID=UPI0013C25E0C|nr:MULTISPECIES: hypothetical protein [unclassified Streptomyces]MCZ4098953.1 hypothetical protein [Streptomyces sp. H39-C1]NEA60713.1 hypothetical protein [Streptomyces sp. SID13666]